MGNKITLFDFSKNIKNVLEIKSEGKLSLDLGKATEEEKRLVKEKVIDMELNEKGMFLNDKSTGKTEQIRRNLQKETDVELLNF